VAGSEHNNELSVPIIGKEFLKQLNNYEVNKKDYAQSSYDGEVCNASIFITSF
jgi:hypothetical protein